MYLDSNSTVRGYVCVPAVVEQTQQLAPSLYVQSILSPLVLSLSLLHCTFALVFRYVLAMASVRQKKKGIRAASSTSPPPKASEMPRPVHSPNVPRAVAARPSAPTPAPPKAPARAAVAQSARQKGKRSPSATTSSTRGASKSNSPSHLVGGAPGTRCGLPWLRFGGVGISVRRKNCSLVWVY